MKTSSLAFCIAIFALLASSLANPPNPDCVRSQRAICHSTFEGCIQTCDNSFETSRSTCDNNFNSCRTNCTSVQTACKNSCLCGTNCTATCNTQCANNNNNNCANRCRENAVNDCKASCDNPHVQCQNSCQSTKQQQCNTNLNNVHVNCKDNCTSVQNSCFTAASTCSNNNNNNNNSTVPPPNNNNNNSTVPPPNNNNNNSTVPPPNNNNNSPPIFRQSNSEVIVTINNKEFRIQSNQGVLEVYLKQTDGNTKSNYKLRITSFNLVNNGQPGNAINVGPWTAFVTTSNSFNSNNNNLTLTGSLSSNALSTKLAGNFAAIGNNSVIFIVQLTSYQQIGNGPNFNFNPLLNVDQILGAFGTGVLTNVKIGTVVTPITRTQIGNANTNNGQSQLNFFYTISSGIFSDLVLTS